MKSRLYLLVVVFALLYLAGWTGYAQGQRSNLMRQAWEYKVDFIDDSPWYLSERAARNQRQINERAAEGWELTAVGANCFYFKRSK